MHPSRYLDSPNLVQSLGGLLSQSRYGEQIVKSLFNKVQIEKNAPLIVTPNDFSNLIKSTFKKLNTDENEFFIMHSLNEFSGLIDSFLLGKDSASKNGVFRVEFSAQEIIDRIAQIVPDCIIISHNHPCGTCIPSIEDLVITRKIKGLCQEFGVKLLDHIIYTDNELFSFRNSISNLAYQLKKK